MRVCAGTGTLLISVEPGRLALAAAEDSAFAAELIDRLAGYDANLLHLGGLLIEECAADYPRGALFWNEAASRFMSALVARHTNGPKPSDGVLDAVMLGRLRDYLMAHLDESIDVATLAEMTKRSQFHFSRVFHRSVGVGPYRYIVYLRLRRAVELIREDRLGSRKSRPVLVSPIRATCRDGCAGFTAFPRPNWSPDSPRQTAGIFTTLPARRF